MTKMPKTRKEYEMNLIAAFCEGMVNGYGIDHEYIHKEENKAIEDFAKRKKFKTDAVEKYIKPLKEFEEWLES